MSRSYRLSIVAKLLVLTMLAACSAKDESSQSSSRRGSRYKQSSFGELPDAKNVKKSDKSSADGTGDESSTFKSLLTDAGRPSLGLVNKDTSVVNGDVICKIIKGAKILLVAQVDGQFIVNLPIACKVDDKVAVTEGYVPMPDIDIQLLAPEAVADTAKGGEAEPLPAEYDTAVGGYCRKLEHVATTPADAAPEGFFDSCQQSEATGVLAGGGNFDGGMCMIPGEVFRMNTADGEHAENDLALHIQGKAEKWKIEVKPTEDAFVGVSGKFAAIAGDLTDIPAVTLDAAKYLTSNGDYVIPFKDFLVVNNWRGIEVTFLATALDANGNPYPDMNAAALSFTRDDSADAIAKLLAGKDEAEVAADDEQQDDDHRIGDKPKEEDDAAAQPGEEPPVAAPVASTASCEHHVQLVSPLVLDFSGAPMLATVLPSASPVRFDLRNAGRKDPTGWVPATAAFLALDLNGDGRINSGAELFGNYTRLPSGSNAANGYAALAQYDLSRKGYLDGKDPIFKHLQAWFDRNQDGVSQAGELSSLAQLGVTRIDVSYADVPAWLARQSDGFGPGNVVPYQGRFYGPAACGSAGCKTYDVYFGTAPSRLVSR